MTIETHWLGRIPYPDALARQEAIVSAIAAGHSPNQLLLLEHDPVYTIGRTRDQSSLRNPNSLPHPVFEIQRGGKATWHGPGQLVGYPIINLTPYGRDLHRHLRILEDILISTATHFGVPASRRDGLTGVWVANRKLASLGVGVRKWIAYHGFALNVTHQCLEGFNPITPCGLEGVTMTSLQTESNHPLSVHTVATHVAKLFHLYDHPNR